MKSLEDIKAQSVALGVPIILGETGVRLTATLRQERPKTVLEIGSGIGYSGAVMLDASEGLALVTVEKDNARFALLKENLRGSTAECLNADANEYLDDCIINERKFDFIFLDGPKGQYARYFSKLDKVLAHGGVLFADNINFHGMVTGETEITKGARTIATSLREFQETLKENPNYAVEVLTEGDGILIAKKR